MSLKYESASEPLQGGTSDACSTQHAPAPSHDHAGRQMPQNVICLAAATFVPAYVLPQPPSFQGGASDACSTQHSPSPEEGAVPPTVRALHPQPQPLNRKP